MNEEICSVDTYETIYLRPCPYGQSCTGQNFVLSDLMYCQIMMLRKHKGEYCDLNEECITDLCVDHKCIIVKDDEECGGDTECENHSFCRSETKTCIPYALKNRNCGNGMECAFGYKCVDHESGIKLCVEQYSIGIGAQADYDDLCESNFRYNNTCYNTKMKELKEFKECEYDSDCKIEIIDESGNVISEDRNPCSVIGQNGKHCKPSTTSLELINYVNAFREVRDNINSNKVHPSLISEAPKRYSPVY